MVKTPKNDDYHDMLYALKNAGAEFLVVGGYAMAAHGLLRGTKDIDIWVRATPENAKRVISALIEFGAPLNGINESDFAVPGSIYQIGVAPVRIDLLTKIAGIDFDSAWLSKIDSELFDVPVPVIGRDALILNKRTVGREQDLLDVKNLEKNAN